MGRVSSYKATIPNEDKLRSTDTLASSITTVPVLNSLSHNGQFLGCRAASGLQVICPSRVRSKPRSRRNSAVTGVIVWPSSSDTSRVLMRMEIGFFIVGFYKINQLKYFRAVIDTNIKVTSYPRTELLYCKAAKVASHSIIESRVFRPRTSTRSVDIDSGGWTVSMGVC
jgi:hypothetical protein